MDNSARGLFVFYNVPTDIVQSATKEKRDALIPFPEADEETPVVGVQDTRSHHQVHRHLPAVSRAERENIGDDGARDQTEENRELVLMVFVYLNTV